MVTFQATNMNLTYCSLPAPEKTKRKTRGETHWNNLKKEPETRKRNKKHPKSDNDKGEKEKEKEKTSLE